MTKLTTAAAVLAAAAAANAGVGFSLNSVDLGGDSASFGDPITTSTSFYQDGFGNNFPPSAMFIGLVPTLQDDSYVAMDAIGGSTGTRTASAPGGGTPGNDATGGFFTAANSLTGGYFTAGGVASGTSPGGNAGVMIAQLTTDGSLSGPNIRVNTSETGTVSLALDGMGDAGLEANSYAVRSGQFGTVYEVWVEVIPTPGTAAIFGAAGLAAVRRRR